MFNWCNRYNNYSGAVCHFCHFCCQNWYYWLFGLVGAQISQKYWGSILGFNFSRPSTPFYVTIFKMAGSKLNMPHIDPSKLHTITNFVSDPMFFIMRNVLVYVKVILEWQPSWKSNMAARKCIENSFWTRVNNLVKFRLISPLVFIHILTYWLF